MPYLEAETLNSNCLFLISGLLVHLLVATLQGSLSLLLLLIFGDSVEFLVAHGISLGFDIDLLLLERSKNAGATSREHWLVLLQD